MDDYTSNKFNETIQDQINAEDNSSQQYSRIYPVKETLGCYWENFFAISAIFRMFFLLFALTGVISSAASYNQDDNGYFTSYSILRIAFLVISAIIFVFELTILVLDIINVFNIPKLKNCPINILILVCDCILFFAILICSIFAFTKATYIAQDIVTTPWGSIVASSYFKADAFFVMAIVGYLMSMLFVEEIIYLVFQILARFLADRKAKKRVSKDLKDSNYSNYY